jgi:hypothetical protein
MPTRTSSWSSGCSSRTSKSEPVSFQEAGESKVLVEMAERGHLKRTGITLDESLSHSFTLEGRTVTEWRMYDSREQALEALGLG